MHLLAAQPGAVSDGSEAVDLGQTPGDIVVLSAADSELALLAAARAKLPADGFPSLRLASLLHLGHNMSVDLYVEAVVRHARLVVGRLLGGRGYWPYGLEQVTAECRERGIPVAFLAGDDQPDAELAGLSTVGAETGHRLWQYCVHGGVDNALDFLCFAATLIGHQAEWREPRPLLRAGLYWPGRHWVTLVAATVLLGALYAIGRDLLKRGSWPRALWWGGVVYLVWIFFFQNVVYKSRHVLPLLPLLAIALAYAISRIGCSGSRLAQVLALCFSLCYGYATLHLVVQHRQGSAIAQVHRYLLSRETADLRVASVPLIKYYLAAQGLKANYHPIATGEDLVRLQSLVDSTDLTVVGSPLADRTPVLARTFYHNPYVNRMWPELTVYEY